jgi:hypothetical protein
MMNQFIGLALSPSMAAMAPPHLPRLFMRSSRGIVLGGTLTLPKRRSTSSLVSGNCTWKTATPTGSVLAVFFAIPTPLKHDLVNVGKETLRAVAFFAAAMFTQNFDNVMMPPKSHILGTPNREG